MTGFDTLTDTELHEILRRLQFEVLVRAYHKGIGHTYTGDRAIHLRAEGEAIRRKGK